MFYCTKHQEVASYSTVHAALCIRRRPHCLSGAVVARLQANGVRTHVRCLQSQQIANITLVPLPASTALTATYDSRRICYRPHIASIRSSIRCWLGQGKVLSTGGSRYWRPLTAAAVALMCAVQGVTAFALAVNLAGGCWLCTHHTRIEEAAFVEQLSHAAQQQCMHMPQCCANCQHMHRLLVACGHA